MKKITQNDKEYSANLLRLGLSRAIAARYIGGYLASIDITNDSFFSDVSQDETSIFTLWLN